jgi:histidinol-phosphate aminotransferase
MPVVRPNIQAMSGYTPGEQPRDGSFIKLNTNENPYPPSPRVFDAIREALNGDKLRKYPDPLGTTFRQTASRILGVDSDGILIGNGSDDILTIVTRACAAENGLIVALAPSYLLYRTLAEIQGCRFEEETYTWDWRIPATWSHPNADVTFVASPNSPSGTSNSIEELAALADAATGLLVIDEAYVDFADSNALALLHKPNVLITRSFSKSYSLAGMRFGFALGAPSLISELYKVKDSYNCDAISLTAAAAAIEDQQYLQSTRTRILATRARLTAEMTKLGFDVTPSQANFVWCRRTDRPVKPIYEELKRRMILVRYMNYGGYGDGLRITVGTDAEIDRLLEALRQLI